MDAEEYRAFTSRGEFIFGQSEVHAFMRAAARKFRGDRGYFGSSRLLPGAFLYNENPAIVRGFKRGFADEQKRAKGKAIRNKAKREEKARIEK